MEYDIVFEISMSGLDKTEFSSPGLLFILIGLVMYRFPKLFARHWSEEWTKRFAAAWLGLAIFWTVTAFTITYLDQESARESYSSGNFKIVEGPIENFDPMPASGYKKESFSVNGVKFEYSDFVVTPGFNNTASKGGPIHEGLPVKISHIDNVILKLEVGKDE